MTKSCILATQSYDFFLTTCHLANASQQSFCRYMIGRKTDTNNDQGLIQSMLSVLQFLSSLQAFLFRQQSVLKGHSPQGTVISLAAALNEHFVPSHAADKTFSTFFSNATEFEPILINEHNFVKSKQHFSTDSGLLQPSQITTELKEQQQQIPGDQHFHSVTQSSHVENRAASKKVFHPFKSERQQSTQPAADSLLRTQITHGSCRPNSLLDQAQKDVTAPMTFVSRRQKLEAINFEKQAMKDKETFSHSSKPHQSATPDIATVSKVEQANSDSEYLTYNSEETSPRTSCSSSSISERKNAGNESEQEASAILSFLTVYDERTLKTVSRLHLGILSPQHHLLIAQQQPVPQNLFRQSHTSQMTQHSSSVHEGNEASPANSGDALFCRTTSHADVSLEYQEGVQCQSSLEFSKQTIHSFAEEALSDDESYNDSQDDECLTPQVTLGEEPADTEYKAECYRC